MLRKLTLLLLWSVCNTLTLYAQSVEWLSLTKIKATEQVVLKACFEVDSLPTETKLTVVSGYNTQIYINNRNVSTSICQPFHLPNDTLFAIQSYAIKRFIKPHNNTIIIVYTPYLGATQLPVIALWLQKHSTNEGWSLPFMPKNIVYAPTNTMWQDNGRLQVDGRKNIYYWLSDEVETMNWIPVETLQTCNYIPLKWLFASTTPTLKTTNTKTHTPLYFDIEPNGISYAFEKACIGFVRITLRGLKAGKKIALAQTDYICNGLLDEQISTPFAPYSYRHVLLQTNHFISTDNIMQVEGIALQQHKDNHFIINSY